MILPPTLTDAIDALEQLRQRATVRVVRARGTQQDEEELRAWQREMKRRSRARLAGHHKEAA